MNSFNTFEERLNYVINRAREKCASQGYDIAVVEELAEQNLKAFYENGFVNLTCRDALEAPDYQWFYFYSRLYNDKKSYFAAREDLPDYVEPICPVVNETNSDWMQKYDFLFFNVRATSLEESKTGTFINSLKLLPVLRSKGLHIAPFLDCNFGNVYCIDSMKTVSPAVVDKDLERAGFSADAQVKFFIDIAHMANFVAGFDLEPHTSQFSRVVLSHPEHFRWIKLNKKRTATLPSKMVKMMEDSEQKKVQKEVKAVVAAALKKAGLKVLEGPETDYDTMKKAHGEIINTLIDKGIWTVPSHTWGGAGLPEFKEYNVQDNYPVFDYRNAKGEDHSGHAFGMLTPYRFYDNLPVNVLPTNKNLPTLRDETIDFFAGLFPQVQEKFGFDYVRLDFVDHVFDSVMASHGKLPVSDRAIPVVLQRVIDKARENKPYIGAMAERMGTDVIEYGSVGFDVLLGCDILGPVSAQAISGTLMYSKELESFKSQVDAIHSSFDALPDGIAATDSNQITIVRPKTSAASSKKKKKDSVSDKVEVIVVNEPVIPTKETWNLGSHRKLATVPWSIDTHDSGNPLFWTKPISEVIGSKGMLLRQFVARFATAGSVRRPKYECMGNQDMSHGLFKANNEEASLQWIGDRSHLALYHAIDDLYNKFSSLIHNGWTTWWEPQNDYCVWAIDTHQGDDGFRGRLICVAALERAVNDLKEVAADNEPQAFVPSISVNVTKDWDRGVKEVTEFLLDGSGAGRRVPVIEGYRIETGALSPRSYKLFLVRG